MLAPVLPSNIVPQFDTQMLLRLHRLNELEKRIEKGLKVFIEVGKALAEIQADKLYSLKYANFDQYCRERWGFTDSHGYRLIKANAVVASVTPIGETPTVPNEAVARELGVIEDETRRRAVWLAAVQSIGGADKVTAPVIRATKTVIETLEITRGYVDTGDGTMTPLNAAILHQTAETASRQRQHIADNSKNTKLYSELIPAADANEAFHQIADILQNLLDRNNDAQVRIVVYQIGA